jgi:metallo-beta-lactamase class B
MKYRDFVRHLVRVVLLVTIGAVWNAACLRPWVRDNTVPMDHNDLPLRIEKLRGHILVAEDYNYWKTNQVIYAHPDAVYFFDASWSYKGARQLVWKAAANSYAEFQGIVLTGFPLHRSGGLSTFRAQRMKIVAHRSTQRLLRQHWDDMQREMASSFDTWRPLPFEAPDEVFDEELSFLDGRIRVIHLPGAHTPDNSVVLFPEERVLYGGSLLSSPLMFLDYADLKAYPAALDRVEALEFDTIICGHGRALRDRSVLREIRAEVRDLARSR